MAFLQIFVSQQLLFFIFKTSRYNVECDRLWDRSDRCLSTFSLSTATKEKCWFCIGFFPSNVTKKMIDIAKLKNISPKKYKYNIISFVNLLPSWWGHMMLEGHYHQLHSAFDNNTTLFYVRKLNCYGFLLCIAKKDMKWRTKLRKENNLYFLTTYLSTIYALLI